jgi:hypothetical protein
MTNKLRCAIFDADALAKLMVRYYGVGKLLSHDEEIVLTAALSMENQQLGGTLHKRAMELIGQRVGAKP